MHQRLILGLSVTLAMLLVMVWFARRTSMETIGDLAAADDGPDGALQDARTQEALALSEHERRIADLLSEAQRVDLGDDQLGAFEESLRAVRSSPMQGRTWERVKRYERTLPLFLATEKALFACLKGMDRDPKACSPTPQFKRVIDENVAAGDLAKDEAGKYLDLLASMKDPKTRPPLPPGGLAFMERESSMKARNMERIAAAVRRVETDTPAPAKPAPSLKVAEPPAPPR